MTYRPANDRMTRLQRIHDTIADACRRGKGPMLVYRNAMGEPDAVRVNSPMHQLLSKLPGFDRDTAGTYTESVTVAQLAADLREVRHA